jgi:4-amino-4-deoxy-L-arabinose transferase-like glycosyltransferase
MNNSISFKQRLPNPTIYIFPPAVVTLFLWSTSPNDVTIIQALAGFILLLMPWTT